MASAFHCSFSFTRIWMNPMSVSTQSNYLRLKKLFICTCAPVGVPFPNSSKICMVPFNLFSKRHSVRSFAVDTLLGDGAIQLERHGTPSFLNQNNSQWSSNDLEGQLQELFDEIMNMIKLGKKDEAIDLLQANHEAVKEQVDSGTGNIAEAAVLDVLLLGYMAIGDLQTAQIVIDELHKIVNELNDDEMLVDSILMHMGSIYAKLEKFDLSICVYRRCLQIMESKYGSKSSFLCTPLLGMAKALGNSRRTPEALEIYQKIINILESCRGEYSEELVVPLSALGNFLIKDGKISDAEHQFDRILKIYTRLYGEKDGRVGTAMCSLANVKCAKGDVNEAIDLYKSALQILKDSKSVPLDDKDMEKMRIDLAELLHVAGRGEEGRTLLEECLFITEKYKGKGHPSLVPNLVNLATSHSRSKNFAEAERLLRIGLQIMMKAAPPDDPSITFPMLHLAVALYNLHRDEEAKKLALDALLIREKAFGKESLPVGEALDCLVSIQTRLGEDDIELVKMLKRVLKIQEIAFGHDSEQVVETLKKLVYYIDKTGKKTEKYHLEKRLSALRNKFKQMAIY
ncbi:uncharacterized protein LOC127256193 [Andrographis paniculata]|uniref:uncharacterized protein LOC127256193 n=1 Tax=Andrographis paniculata TaxID=175694 RepID=UPI0021E8838A|nr:uncharacterized protein LOC127256193 [Andrographis paniculata]XP_051138014.1 uncharacterized protein LOC127256193 [Andrographis paniculata]XP_051138015.1 uncharacterized protein LOC127256193 [Andrographis paniculata]XP_051138016.1 uncharacterized protein LOC127256193 [Andrographis paniculata]